MPSGEAGRRGEMRQRALPFGDEAVLLRGWPPGEPGETFLRAIHAWGVPGVAAQIGLHANTVRRWVDVRRVPAHYLADLRRLLEEPERQDDAADRYFTMPETAARCLARFRETMDALGVDLAGHTFIEPSMGEGCFYQVLPAGRRLGIDIASAHPDCIRSDYLRWKPEGPGPFVVVGNPPFGLRGHLALQFINHSAAFADAVAFILPQNFGSDGKGAPGKRVRGYALAAEADLSGEHFSRPDGSLIRINTIFQVWTRVGVERIAASARPDCSGFVSVKSLSNGGTPASTRNKAWIGHCDVYLPSTTYSGMKAYERFEDLPNRRGYGVVIHKRKPEIKRLLMGHDWRKTCFPSTNSAVNLRKSLIEDVVIESGLASR